MATRLKYILMIVFCLSELIFALGRMDAHTVISPQSIMHITYENSDRIKSAFYKLEAAKYNFKLFESEYTQFNPLNFNSDLTGNSDVEYGNEVSVGMRKEFFDGSSIEATVGNSSEFGKGNEERYAQYVDAEAQFPLFISNRKLNRLIKRTFEENELYSKNLEYVDAIRKNIREALENYYDLVPRLKIEHMLRRYRDQLTVLLDKNRDRLDDDGREQIKGEIDALESRITGWSIQNNSLLINLQRFMAVDRVSYEQIQSIELDFENPHYFGRFYIEESIDSIYAKALDNDTEFKILRIIRKNALEKRKLAEKGEWDIFARLGARYYLHEQVEGIEQDRYFTASGGISISRFDNKVLSYTIAKAEADISAIDYTMKDRKNEISTEIAKLKDSLLKKKDQLLSTARSLNSLEGTLRLKTESLLAGQESVDVFLQSFRVLVDLEQRRYRLENNFLDTVRDFDYICGVYFEFLDVNLD